MAILDVARRWAGPALVRARALRGRLRARRGNIGGEGVVSVVIPVHNVAPYLDACLRSVLGQDHDRLDVIVIDDASTDATPAILERWHRRDPRVRVITRTESRGPNAARNLALAEARGEFVTFLDGDDVLLAGAYRDALASLRASGSDFAVASYERLEGAKRTTPAFWVLDAHAADRRGVTLAEWPEAMVNAVQWSKVYRRAFWEGAGLSFPEAGHYQDQIVTAHAFARAATFDVLHRPTVVWRIRDDGSSMTQQYRALGSLRDRFATARRVLDIYRVEASPAVVRARLVQYLSNDFAITASTVTDLDDAAWHVLREELAASVPAPFDDEIWLDVPAEFKVLYALILEGDRDRALEYVRRGGLRILDHALIDVAGVAHIALPFWGDESAAVPLECFRAAPRELRAFGVAL
ncbi:glycosyltransferase family 2 protein [Agromyces atrinae]|uniref:CDP-glycerol glycerophosphotransferase n=1 Tax=Agromyces atrinae TaxID=592376 RepID=A0A4Q2MA58_9MICO|nr:glycosyltransferase family 2 protein [Agromyces atrinae]NYD66668.1 CDP-glycerol glycerophosphotransferase [Agromyces atrinae]RXZ87333.1 glycosyltransferase family 2 protein [Agromyces atrinae]